MRPFHLALAARRTAVRALSANHRSGKIGWHWDMRGLLDPQKADEARQETMTVIPFRDRRAARPPRRPVEPPPALGKPAAASDPGDSGDDAEFYRLRARQNWAVLVLVIVLVLGGAWLIERLAAFSRALACYEFGHRNCMPLKIDLPPR